MSFRHLLGIETLTKNELLDYLHNAKSFVEVGARDLKKVPAIYSTNQVPERERALRLLENVSPLT